MVRYIVNDIDAAIAFYTKQLNFTVVMHPAPEFAILARENLHLALNKPGGHGGGGMRMPDGTLPGPGGWNRFVVVVEDIESTVARMRNAGCKFRNEIVTGIGGKEIILEDPSGNPVELFQYLT